MTRNEIAQAYDLDGDGINRSPGKFEGEHFSTIALHSMALDGAADESFSFDDGEHFDVFLLTDWTDAELNAFSLTVGTFAIVLMQGSNGFISARSMNRERFAAFEAMMAEEVTEN